MNSSAVNRHMPSAKETEVLVEEMEIQEDVSSLVEGTGSANRSN